MVKTLVLTVGGSPIPVLLAILTHAHTENLGADAVVLVHSGTMTHGEDDCTPQARAGESCIWDDIAPDGAEPDWGQLFRKPGVDGSACYAATVAHAAREMLGSKCPPITFLSIGDNESDLSAITTCLDEASIVMDGKCVPLRETEVALDYTGGTVAMSAGAMIWYLGLPDENRRLSSYVDYTHNLLRYAAKGNTSALSLYLDENFTLDRAAFLHGFRLVCSKPQQPRNDAEKVELTAAQRLDAILQRHAEDAKGCSACSDLLGDAVKLDRHPFAEFDGLNRREDSEDTGSDEGANLVTVIARPLTSNDDFAEFDGLARWGNRITTIEVKSKTKDFLNATGWRVRAATAVFGALTSTTMVTAEKEDPKRHEKLMRELKKAAGRPLHDVTLKQLDPSGPDASDLLHNHLFPKTASRGASPYLGGANSKVSAPLLVTAAGARSLATLGAIRSWYRTKKIVTTPEDAPGGRVLILLSKEHANQRQEKKWLRELCSDIAPGVKVDYAVVDLTDEDAVRRVVEAESTSGADVTLDVTAGTKAATIGMVRARAAAKGGALSTAEVVATNPRTRRRSTLTGTCAAEPEELPWGKLLDGHAQPSDPADAPKEVQDLLGQAPTGSGALLWQWCDNPLLATDNCRYWAITVADRLTMVVEQHAPLYPAPEGSQAPEPDSKEEKKVKCKRFKERFKEAENFAAQADLAVEFLFGDAASTMLINPFPQDPDIFQCFKERNDPTDPEHWYSRRLNRLSRPFHPILLYPPEAQS